MSLKKNSEGELVEVSPFRTRQNSIYYRGSNKSFKISRSKFSNFLSCKRCFYLDRVKGLKEPSLPGWAWIDEKVLEMKTLLEFDEIPEINKSCEYCAFLEGGKKF